MNAERREAKSKGLDRLALERRQARRAREQARARLEQRELEEQAKGREWGSVQLADDFPDHLDEEELRLLYVACTRAKLELDLTNLLKPKSRVV